MSAPAFGLYAHIRANRWRSAALLIGLFVLVYALAWALMTFVLLLMTDVADLFAAMREAARLFLPALPFITLAVAIWIGVGYAANVAIIRAVTGAHGVTREEEPVLHRLAETLCISRGMRVPKLMVIESPALNAFASGVTEDQFTITVTRGLLQGLSEPELEAVLAHELTHIRNGDVRLMIVAIVIVGVISFVSELLFRGVLRSGTGSSRRGKNGAGPILFLLAIMAIAYVLGALIRFSLSRSREYLADAGAVELTQNPDALISALLKISGRADLEGVPSGVMDMCIENDPDGLTDLFATHPSIAKRVQALISTAGGVMPPRPPALAARTDLPSVVEARGPWGPPPPPV